MEDRTITNRCASQRRIRPPHWAKTFPTSQVPAAPNPGSRLRFGFAEDGGSGLRHVPPVPRARALPEARGSCRSRSSGRGLVGSLGGRDTPGAARAAQEVDGDIGAVYQCARKDRPKCPTFTVTPTPPLFAGGLTRENPRRCNSHALKRPPSEGTEPDQRLPNVVPVTSVGSRREEVGLEAGFACSHLAPSSRRPLLTVP
jgi:hypothetical protein